MKVFEFCNLCRDEYTSVSIYDANACMEVSPWGIVFAGTMREASCSAFADCEILSFDLVDNGLLVLNIDTHDTDAE